ncbi:MAG: hypothetical protein QOJ41_2463, partial [Acidobacteriaceae bacterium]|nr:hypothetical protein [Acidobacteriaceae bacterium]
CTIRIDGSEKAMTNSIDRREKSQAKSNLLMNICM